MNAKPQKHISDYLNNDGKQMKLAIQLVSGYGGEFQSWRLSESDANSYTNIDTYIDMAKTAEKGKIHTLFIADTPSFGGAGGGGDIARKSPAFPMEPMVMLSAVAYATQKIGIVATFSTTYNLPYNLARQLKTLDVISGGRMGWNAVTTGTPQTAYNFGNQPLPPTQVRYDMSDEMVRVVQTLWATWGKDAWIADKTTGEFADMSQIRPANFDGKYFQVQGALPIPPSPQGQPPIFQAGGGQNGIELAGKFASGVYSNPFTIEDARYQRALLKQSAIDHGRQADDINMFSGFMFTIGKTKEDALNRRRQLLDYMGDDIWGQVNYLGAMIGVNLRGVDIVQPIPKAIRPQLRANPQDPRSERALELVNEGWSIKDVLAHGVINYHPVVVGTAEDVADFMEHWFLAGATDGFSLAPDSQMGVTEFVEQVVPILQARGIYHNDYEGDTLRDHLGVPYQYGINDNQKN